MGKDHNSSRKEKPLESSPSLQAHPTRDKLIAMGKNLREKCQRHLHSVWKAPENRADPLFIMEGTNKGRIPQLLSDRHERMLKSPFTFYHGTAQNMAADLATTPAIGIRVQACGDSHLMNSGSYATPKLRVIFDINDLDETLPAPWEWDIKRLAASCVLSCRDNGISAANDGKHEVLIEQEQ